MVKLNRQFLLVCSLAFMLLGFQAVQGSSIHDHSQHQVDCVLCHFDSHDQAIVTQADLNLIQAQPLSLVVFVEPVYLSFYYPSYQGRSPPRFYS